MRDQRIRMANMTSSGRRLAALIAVAIAFMLPKSVDCGYAGATCYAHAGPSHQSCMPYEVEPLGFYLLELALHRDVGFAYSSSDGCQ